MKIGLIDVDGHRFPNLALMRISAYHKARGDTVEWWWSDFVHYDIVYMSKIFSDSYSPDVPEPINADKVIKGGTGYAISMQGGKEVFLKEHDRELPPEIERMFPDYSLYPQYPFAVSMTSRGCPRGCAFCHVAAKEGRCARKVADMSQRVTQAIDKETEKWHKYRKVMEVLQVSDAQGIRLPELEKKAQKAQQEWLEAAQDYARIFWEERCGIPHDQETEVTV